MKTFIKTIALPLLIVIGLTTQVTAQTRKTSKNSKTSKTTKVSKRVPSTKVTYKKTRKKITSVRKLPNRKVIKNNGQNYYYSNNKFYTESRGRFINVAPKIGLRIKFLPPNHHRIRFNNSIYFNVSGIFYKQYNDEYEVVDPEIGTIVYQLPNDYEKVTINGLTYYEYANVLYEKIQVDGTRAYEVVGIIEMDF